MIASRRVVRRSGWVIAAVVLATFGYLLGAEFTWWDDASTVHQNPLLNPATLDSLTFFWTTPQHSIYIPLTYTVWFLLSFPARVTPDTLGIALNPAWFHAANIGFHMLSAFAVAGILRRVFHNEWAALLGAIAFAVHPVQVESVAWVSGLKDVMSGCFVLWAIYWFVRARQTEAIKPGVGPASERRAWALSASMLVLGLLSKPSAMTAPALLLAIDVLILRTPWRRALRTVVPFALVAVPIMIVARLSQPASWIESPLWARPLIAMDSIAFYFGKLIFPHPLTLDYGRTPMRVLETGQAYWTWVVAFAAATIGAWMFRQRLYVAACGLSVIALAPAHTLGLVRFEFQDVSTVADHYLYVAMLGVAIILAWAVVNARPMRYVAVGLLILWCGRSAWQTRHWQDHETLMLHTYEQTPFGKVGATNLTSWGILNRDLPMAKHFSEIALTNRPDEPIVLTNAAYVALLERNDARAKEMILRNVAAHERFFGVGSPRVAEAWVKAGQAYLDTKRVAEARWCVENAQRLDPQSASVQTLADAVMRALREDSPNESG